MTKFIVWANACEFGEIQAETAQDARDIAARMAGYESEADLQAQDTHGQSDIMTREITE